MSDKTYMRTVYTSSKGKFIIWENKRLYLMDNDYELITDNFSMFDGIISLDE